MRNMIGVAWYRREDYDELRAWFDDGDSLPDTYEEWRKKALQTYEYLADQGHTLDKVFLERESFDAWCKSRGVRPTAAARTQFCAEYVQGQELSRRRS